MSLLKELIEDDPRSMIWCLAERLQCSHNTSLKASFDIIRLKENVQDKTIKISYQPNICFNNCFSSNIRRIENTLHIIVIVVVQALENAEFCPF